MLQLILKKFELNTPILIEELNSLLKQFSKARIYQLINKLIESGELVRFNHGVYYLPKNTEIGPSRLNVREIIKKKYISNKEKVYGFYGGAYLLNQLGFSTQVPNVVEIYTNNESTRLRRISLDNQNIVLKKCRVKINKNNYKILQLLELLNILSINDIEKNSCIIKEFITNNNIDNKEIIKYLKFYPAKTTKNFLICEGENVFTRK